MGNCAAGQKAPGELADLQGTQEQRTVFRKLSKHGRKPVRMNMELLPELKHKKYTEGGSRDRDYLGGVNRRCCRM